MRTTIRDYLIPVWGTLKQKTKEPVGFLIVYTVLSALFGALIIMTRSWDGLLIILIGPIILAAQQFSRRVYIPTTLLLLVVSLVVIINISGDPSTSSLMILLITLATLAVGEVIFGLRRSRVRFERQLSASEQRFRQALEDMQLLVVTLDLEGRITFCNDAFLQLVKRNREEVTGQNWFTVFENPDNSEALLSSYRYRIRSRTLRMQNESEIQISPGIYRLIAWNNTLLTDLDGSVIGETAIGQDITDTRRGHRLLQESERRYRTIFETMAEAFTMNRIVLDENGVAVDHIVIESNYAFEAQTGLKRSEIINKPMSSLMPYLRDIPVSGEDSRRLLDVYAEVAETGIPVFIAEHYSAPLQRWYTLSISSPEPGMFAVASTNITMVKETEAALRESEARYRMLISQIPIGVQVFNADGLCIDVNPAQLALFGVDKATTLVGSYNIQQDHMARQVGTQGGFLTALQGEQTTLPDIHFDFTRADPRFTRTEGHRNVRVTFFPVRGPTGEVELVVALNEDMTERKEAEELLRRQAIALETMHDGVIITALDGSILDWNQGAFRVFGYRREEALGRNTNFLYHTEERQNLAQRIMTEMEVDGKWTGEIHCVRKDGTEVFCEVVFVPLYDENGQPIAALGVNRDVTERKQAEDALLNLTLELEQRVADRTIELMEQKARLQTILDTMADGVIYTTQTHIEYVNNALVDMIGCAQHDLIDKPVESLRQLAANAGSEQSLRLAANTGVQSWQAEVRLKNKSGGEMDAVLTSTRMSDGGTVTLVRNISQEKLLQTQKDRFITNASHEFRTPLANIKTRLYLMRRQPEKIAEHLGVLENVTTHMTTLLEELLEITRFNREAITLHRTLTVTQELISAAVQSRLNAAKAKGLSLTAEMPHTPLYIMADRKRVLQALTHLITNAIRYSAESQTVTVRLYVEPGTIRDEAIIDVRDSSGGIPDHLLPGVFEPFFRPSEGDVPDTGTGLALARQIIQLHGGEIEVISEPDQGSIFRIRLILEYLELLDQNS